MTDTIIYKSELTMILNQDTLPYMNRAEQESQAAVKPESMIRSVKGLCQ